MRAHRGKLTMRSRAKDASSRAWLPARKNARRRPALRARPAPLNCARAARRAMSARRRKNMVDSSAV
eukprot:CAMPEP_0185168824 /NCGR_PEP_ID=MMETSP1139-20130426/16440_1 /TAXON_ID=298111 /ORGANISM="Pavlova sp., Strain CCMP459" /LENGTH=66 /DNA_ID=CAMNT_0027734345 /DNA_START=148 /DNA_END=348 /DNA_ORIENTATION=-